MISTRTNLINELLNMSKVEIDITKRSNPERADVKVHGYRAGGGGGGRGCLLCSLNVMFRRTNNDEL